VAIMIVSLLSSLAIIVGSAAAVDPLSPPPPHATVLDAAQLKTLVVGSEMVDPNGTDNMPLTVTFNRDGTFASGSYGIIYMIRTGRYQLKGNRLCMDGTCSVVAHDHQGYVLGTPVRGRWSWKRRVVFRQKR
jgi:hypothetical protein